MLKCRTPGVPLDDRNLVWRAAAALWKALGRAGEPADTVVTLEKAIPMQAGLAAAAPTRPRRCRCWRGSGAVRRCRCFARCRRRSVGCAVLSVGRHGARPGRGEEMYPLVDLPRHWVVIVRPPFGVSTVEAYTWYDEDRAAGVREPRSDLQILPVPWPSRAAQMINDLEPPVLRRHPEIGAIKTALRERARLPRRCRGAARRYSGCSGRGPPRPRAAPAGQDGARRRSSATRCRAPSTRSAPVPSCAAFDAPRRPAKLNVF